MKSGNAVTSHSGLISSETLYEKREVLLRPNARKKNLIGLRSAACLFFCFTLVCQWCGRTGGLTVTWSPKFLGWVDYHIFLGIRLRSSPLLVRLELRYECLPRLCCHYPFCRTWAGFSVVLGSTGCRVRAVGAYFGGGGGNPGVCSHWKFLKLDSL